MKLVIHDRGKACNEEIKTLLNESDELIIVGGDEKINHCIGCFGCWIKTPTECVIKDSYNRMPEKLKQADTMIIISECNYGMYSPFVKNILDRSIGYVHPYFTRRNGEMHHKLRYNRTINMVIYYYGETTEQERELAENIAKANTLNMNLNLKDIRFFSDYNALRESVR